MSTKVNPIPEGYHTVTPYMIIKQAADAIEFYKKAFGAVEIFRLPKADGKIGHAEIQIGNSRIMLADEQPEMQALGPQSLGGTSVFICLYVEHVDAAFEQAVMAGAKVLRPVQDQFYGDRAGMLEDPFGYKWNIASHIEDLTAEEIQKRMAATC
jgi:PhnB protein